VAGSTYIARSSIICLIHQIRIIMCWYSQALYLFGIMSNYRRCRTLFVLSISVCKKDDKGRCIIHSEISLLLTTRSFPTFYINMNFLQERNYWGASLWRQTTEITYRANIPNSSDTGNETGIRWDSTSTIYNEGYRWALCLVFESPGLKSRPEDQLSYPGDFVVLRLLSSSRKILEHSLKLYCYCFL
jgi:hypothetical protein